MGREQGVPLLLFFEFLQIELAFSYFPLLASIVVFRQHAPWRKPGAARNHLRKFRTDIWRELIIFRIEDKIV